MKITLIIVISCLISFYLGKKYQALTPGENKKYMTEVPVQIQSKMPHKDGTLPVGTLLYHYKTLPETTTYYTFINLKNHEALTPYETKKFNLVSPLSGYID